MDFGTLKETYKKNRKNVNIWLVVILGLIIIAVFKPSRRDIEAQHARDLALKDTSAVHIDIVLPKYQYESIKREADEKKMSPSDLLVESYVSQSNIENIKDVFKKVTSTDSAAK